MKIINQKKSKGFTLVELLVVIVVLAIMALAAGTNIFSGLETARQGTFKNDAEKIVDVANTAYSIEALGAGAGTETVTQGRLYCTTIKNLVDKGYLEKDLDTDDNGTDDLTGRVVIIINANNVSSSYISYSTEDYSLANSKSDSIQNASLGGGGATGNDYTCTEDAQVIADKLIP